MDGDQQSTDRKSIKELLGQSLAEERDFWLDQRALLPVTSCSLAAYDLAALNLRSNVVRRVGGPTSQTFRRAERAMRFDDFRRWDSCYRFERVDILRENTEEEVKFISFVY